MATTSNVPVTPGSGKDVATYSYTEDAVTKDLQRVALNESDGSDTQIAAKLGILTETVPASDTASSGLNGRLQRIAQRLTTLIGSVLGTTDAGSSIASSWGVSGVPFTSTDQHGGVASVTDAPTSGQKLVIDDIIFSVDTAMWVKFQEETSGTILFGPWYCSPSSGPIQVSPRGKKKLATADKKMQVITSVAGNITVSASYHSEA